MFIKVYNYGVLMNLYMKKTIAILAGILRGEVTVIVNNKSKIEQGEPWGAMHN
jgi:hypothetical protein